MKKIIIFTAVLVALLFPKNTTTNTAKSKEEKKPAASAVTTKTTVKKKAATLVKTEKQKVVKDTTPPVITVEDGDLHIGDSFLDTAYYSVKDDTTKHPDIKIEGDVDTGVEGDYVVTVYATDEANNTSSANFTIHVVAPTCDGTSVTGNCVLDGVRYNKYIYHPAVEQQSHTEQRSSTKQVITDYCTLCNDDTYSPSCATGRGACSHHGGVKQWNAPRYGTETETWDEEVIDTPAQAEYYETEVAQ